MNRIDEENRVVQAYIGALLGDGGTGGLAQARSDHAEATPDRKPLTPNLLGDAADHTDDDKLSFMMFTIHRLGCAIAASEVKTVIALPDRRVKYKDNQPVQYCPSHYGDAIDIINSRRVLFPEGHPSYDDTRPYQYLIILNAGDSAIACDDIDKVVAIPAMEVSWRALRGTRPWLAGMITSTRYPIIDPGIWRLESDCC